MAYTDDQYGGFIDPNTPFTIADPNAQTAQAPAPGAPAAKTSGDQINAWYQQYLGRQPGTLQGGAPNPTENAWASWSNMDPSQAEAGIKGSAEAQAYAAKGSTPGASATQPGFTARPENPLWTQLRNQLASRAGQSLTVDPNDPNIKAGTEAYAADQTRTARNFLSSAAEAGRPGANLDAANRHAAEVAGQNTAGFRAQLIGREVDARRKEISDALNGLYGALSFEDQRRLQEEDRNLSEKQYGSNTAQQAWEDQYKSIFG